MTMKLLETTIRDFGGGWDVSDSDKSLTSKYQTVSDNVIRRTDGSFEVRAGTYLFSDLRTGVETVEPAMDYTVSVDSTVLTTILSISNTNPTVITVDVIDIDRFEDEQIVTITGANTAHAAANGTHEIANVDAIAGTFELVGVDTSSASGNQTTGTMQVSAYIPGTMPGVLRIQKNGHGYSSGDHINITHWSTAIGGIEPEQILGIHGIVVLDADSFAIYVRAEADASTSASITIGWTHDTHLMSGRDIFGRYYQDHLIVFDDTGEIFAVDVNGNATNIWSYEKAHALDLQPWGPCKRVSAEIIRGKLIAVNGALNDKPLEIDGTSVNYLVDAASLSNAAIPRADFIISSDRYVLLISTEYGATMVEVSAKNTVATFSRDPDPSDAVEVDLGMLTQSVETAILGANVIRSKVFVAYHDRSQLGTLGVYIGDDPATAKHEPDFKDNVSQLGTYAHHSIVSLGNDLLCVGLNGVNSLAISSSSGEFTPTTISDLIHPVLLRHLTRLTEDDRRFKTFAVWDPNLRNYMLFMPKYSAITSQLPHNPIIASTALQPYNLMYLRFPSHAMDAGDEVDITGATDEGGDGFVFGHMVNGRCRVRAVYDDDTLIIETDPYPTGVNVAYGGLDVTATPVNDETPCYVYEYNPRLKIKRWTRFRGWNYNWGTISQLNKLFFGKDGKIYRMGSATDKYYGDKVNEPTIASWEYDTTYHVGDRIRDPECNNQVYVCVKEHTSPTTGTFMDYRHDIGNVWEVFEGIPIKWELETGWTDFKERMTNKQIEIVAFDTKGSAPFEFSVYSNNIDTDFESFLPIPRRVTGFIGQDAPGFGGGTQPYGGGRNTRQQWLRGMPVEGKQFKLRFAGESTKPLQINSATLYYHSSKVIT